MVPYAPGGVVDFMGRTLGQRLSQQLGQPVVMDNRPGAGGIIGIEYTARSAPDGHTLVVMDPAIVINPSLQEKVPYDLLKDLQTVSVIGSSPLVLVVHPGVPAASMAQLVEYARANPGKLNFVSAGIGTTPHMAGEMLKLRASASMQHVPYKGSGPAMADLVGGQVLFSFASMASAVPFVRAGRLRAIAVSGSERSALFPDVPTVAESGLAGFASEDWQGILAPAKTPPEIIGKLNAEIGRILALPEMKVKLRAAGFEAKPSTPEWFAQFIQAETLKWAGLLKAIGIKAQ